MKEIVKYKSEPNQDMYLIYQIEKECEKEFNSLNVDLSRVVDSNIGFRPKSITLEHLLRAKVKS